MQLLRLCSDEMQLFGLHSQEQLDAALRCVQNDAEMKMQPCVWLRDGQCADQTQSELLSLLTLLHHFLSFSIRPTDSACACNRAAKTVKQNPQTGTERNAVLDDY